MRASTYNIPRFLHCCQETIDGGSVLPRQACSTPSPHLPSRPEAAWTSSIALPRHQPGLHLHRDADAPFSRMRSRNSRSMTSVCWSPPPGVGEDRDGVRR